MGKRVGTDPGGSSSVTPDLRLRPVLSLFPGAGLLDRAFEAVGFCVVECRDQLLGGEIRNFRGRPNAFGGVIGGPPCTDFSSARRSEPTGEGVELLREFLRIVRECEPDWWLLENVPRVPDVRLEGYTVSRVDLRASEFGLRTRRLRHFQFGSRDAWPLIVKRGRPAAVTRRAVTASEGTRIGRRDYADFCQLMGLPGPLELPALTLKMRYRVVGNGVAIPVGIAVAEAVVAAPSNRGRRICGCGCGREINSRQTFAGASCRKRMQRRRDAAAAGGDRQVTIEA